MFYEDKCTLCGQCLIKCPYLAYPEDKAKEEFKKLIDGKSTPVTAECITCAACNMFCPEGANPFDLINDRQEETGSFKVTGQWLGLMQMASKFPSQIIKGETGKPVMNLCTMGDILRHVIEGQLFDGLTLTKGGDYFCYLGWIHAGKPSMLKKNAQKFVDKLTDAVKEAGTNEVICYHDDCYAMLVNKIKEFGIKLPFKSIHIIEYLRDYVKDHKDQIKKLNIKIGYQQPCASRYSFKKDKILDELFELIGVQRVDRKYDREGALCCCGVMGAMTEVPKEVLNEWQMKNVMDAKEHGAEAMVFLCPLCVVSLKSKVKSQGLESYIISNLVRLALGEKFKN